MDRVVKIGGAAGFFADSGLNVPQLLDAGVDYLVFDALAESVMGRLATQAKGDPEGGWVRRFLDAQIGPYLHEIARRGVKVVSNAGGLNPAACAEAIRKCVASEGLTLKVAAVEGDNLTGRVEDFARLDLKDMRSGTPLRAMLDEADEVLSFTAYVGAFPVADALAGGADIVVTGRAVDTAPTLGALIHEFAWGPEDYDLLAGGMAAAHLLECGSAAIGGAFTDWRDVPGWEDMGYPIAECRADGTSVITKPPGAGGLVKVGSVSEQILYEVDDVSAYVVPDVVCDWTQLQLTEAGPDRVQLSGAKGLPRTPTYKACLTYNDGWKAVCAYPVYGRDAAQKGRRMAEAILARGSNLLRQRNLGEWRRSCIEIIGAESAFGAGASAAAQGVREVIARVAVDHESREAAEMFSAEALPFIAHVAGAGSPVQGGVSAIQRLGSFLIEKAMVPLTISDGQGARPARVATDGEPLRRRLLTPPELAEGAALDASVSLLDIAWVRSGDKGDLVNIAVIAREPGFLPYITAALTTDRVAGWFAHLFNEGARRRVERQYAPGLQAFNFVLHECMGGGLASNLRLDSAGKGFGQVLLEIPIPVTRQIEARVRGGTGAAQPPVLEPLK
jgi:hypothetical protein